MIRCRIPTAGGPAGCLQRAVFVLMALTFAARAALAIDLADVATPSASFDLLPYLAGLETSDRTVAIERPDSHSSVRDLMTLEAKGPGPVFRWRAAGFRNSGTEAAEVVITVPDQSFVGSGFHPLRQVGKRVVSITTAGGIELEPLDVTGQGAYAFTLGPGATAAIAFEVRGGQLPAITVWKREAFQASKDKGAFFRGAILGISLLLAVAILALYGFRARAIFPVAAGFAASCVAFMMMETGHLSTLMRWVGLGQPDLQVFRAAIEGSMAAFLVLLLATQSELFRQARLLGRLLVVAGGLAFAIPIYGLAEPLLAATIARALFAVTAAAGFALIFYFWQQGEVKAEQALISWSAILLWTFLAVAAALAGPANQSLAPVLLAALCAVLVVLGFSLAHLAFSQGYLSREYFREAGRHALAMAGARTYVWDWQPEEGELYVSPEIERALGQPDGIMGLAATEAFLELMHPSDRSAYLAAVEEAVFDGRLTIEREFRLRHGDGSYRWFQLRARAIPGHARGAARCIGILIDVTAAKIAEERLLNDAVHDLVTGLPNRALFLDRLDRTLHSAAAVTGGRYVLLVGLDRFKIVNDALGHEAGDALLAVIGRRLLAETRHGGTVARLPGDQFAILHEEALDGRDVETFAGALLKSVARPILLDGQEYVLTASIGIAELREPGASAEQLLKDAALALYEAKRRGVQTIEVFSPGMRDDRAELVILEADLRRAIERKEIEVHYQPIARLADMHLAGFEALVRWNHPNLGLLAPESFVGLAEETGLIGDIGRAVLNEAARQLGIWQRAYRPAEPVFVAVNISSAQLIEASLLDEIRHLLHRENLQRGTLKIEVTESLVMQYPERASQILVRLRELGVGIACDDFGTGYSSLSSLRRLPFDTLKVDRSFISGEGRDHRAGVILDSVIAMAHALGLSVVAEGIESQEQVDWLGSLGCDFGQGYFIGRPMTAKQVNDALVGLPYGSGEGRTAITWLWERALKDPPPVPRVRRMTTAEIGPLSVAPTPEGGPAEPKPPRRPPLSPKIPEPAAPAVLAGGREPPSFVILPEDQDIAAKADDEAGPEPAGMAGDVGEEAVPAPSVTATQADAGMSDQPVIAEPPVAGETAAADMSDGGHGEEGRVARTGTGPTPR